jgi:NAD(P)-dependent dehydrogenase (short-subunit alcohol dehydrogenase family)
MSATFTPPSGSWLVYKALQGMTNATVTGSEADLRGKWVLITGANNGIGREAAIKFAEWGASIILACREPPSYETHPEKVVEECKAAAAAVTANHDAAQIFEWWEVDMADFSSVEALAARWNEIGRPLDLLVNNAGIAGTGPPPRLTKDGFELLHQVNFLSHTLLTLSVLPSIAKAPSPRILCTTSCFHYLGKPDLVNANTAVSAYANNKLYFQAWLTELQARMLKDPRWQHIAAHSVHPGFVHTSIWVNTPVSPLTMTIKLLSPWIGITPAQGSVALTNAAAGAQYSLRPAGEGEESDEFRGGARYISRIWEAEPSPCVRNPVYRKEVWDFVAGELNLSGRAGVPAEWRKST